jgi:UDP-N-acetyl-D-glucosamine dehydrogenase
LKPKIAIIGLGYVGIPLAVAAAGKNFKILGIDIDESKVRSISSETLTTDPLLKEIQNLTLIGDIKVTSDFKEVSNCDIVVVAVPTPLDSDRRADLSKLISAVKSASEFCKKGVLIIIESTVAPGTVRNMVLPLIKQVTGFSDDDFDLAYSPERIDPGNLIWKLENTPKLVAGITSKATNKASQFYSTFVDSVKECKSIEVAETAKLLENAFRLVNISFINEVSIFCSESGINIQDVVDAASTKPYGFMSFYPSVGIGGHCIPVDPIYLSEKASSIGRPIKLIEIAAEINLEMPKYFVVKAEQMLDTLNGKKIIVIGVSYKPNVSDTRETPVEALIIGLRTKGAVVSWHDEIVKEWKGERSSPLSNDFDLAILATPHTNVDLTKLRAVPMLNTRV